MLNCQMFGMKKWATHHPTSWIKSPKVPIYNWAKNYHPRSVLHHELSQKAHSSDIRNTCIFWRCSKRSIFKYFKIWKCEYVKYVNTMSKTLSKLSLSCAQTQRQRWSSIFKYFQVFFKKPKKTYNTRMFESNWEYVTTMKKLLIPAS
jgi:hypothetical protein